MANTENIEAKLCAYVDGELDDAGRAEIEAHLESNPQHRQLLTELMGQREMLASLPRAKAPDDLFETVQSHLERAVLLDTGRSHIAGRINPWPNRLAKAAVLLLAVGLAALIYFVLPVGKPTATHVALSPASSPSDATGFASAIPRTDDLSLARVETEDTLRRRASEVPGRSDKRSEKAELDALASAPSLVTPAGAPASPPAAPEASAAPGESSAPAAALSPSVANAGPSDVFSKTGERLAVEAKGGGGTYTNIFADGALNQGLIEEKLKQAPPVASDSVVIFVSASDPDAVNRQVQAYFANNSIRWEEVAEAAPLPIAQNQVVAASRAQHVEGQLRSTAPSDAASFKQMAKGGAEQINRRPAGIAESENASQLQARALGQDGYDSTAQKGAVSAEDRAAQQAPATAQFDSSSQQPAPASLARQQAAAVPSQSQLLIARGMTRKQASELNNTLSFSNQGRVANYSRSKGVTSRMEPLGVVTTQQVIQSPNEVSSNAAAATPTTDSINRDNVQHPFKVFLGSTTQSAGTGQTASGQPSAAPASMPADEPAMKLADPAASTRPIAQQGEALSSGAVGAKDQLTDEAATSVPAHQEPVDVVDVVVVVQPGPATPSPVQQQQAIESPAPVPAPPTAEPAAELPPVTQPATAPAQQ